MNYYQLLQEPIYNSLDTDKNRYCVNCKNTLIKRNGETYSEFTRRKYCNMTCVRQLDNKRHPREIRHCFNCKKTIDPEKYKRYKKTRCFIEWAQYRLARFCSKKCQYSYESRTGTGFTGPILKEQRVKLSDDVFEFMYLYIQALLGVII